MAWHNPGQLEADLTMTSLAVWLREFVGRPVVDRTGLSGYYSVTLRLSRRRPAVDTIRDDLGLQLVPSRIVRETVVVERFDPRHSSSFFTQLFSLTVERVDDADGERNHDVAGTKIETPFLIGHVRKSPRTATPVIRRVDRTAPDEADPRPVPDRIFARRTSRPPPPGCDTRDAPSVRRTWAGPLPCEGGRVA
jgi:hypothetical protein